MKQTTIYDFLEESSPAYNFVESIHTELATNTNKISPTFIKSLVTQSVVTYNQLTGNMRVCTITLPTGHEVIGIAQVLDSSNDIESIGNQVALTNATNELWKLVGTIAKLFI